MFDLLGLDDRSIAVYQMLLRQPDLDEHALADELRLPAVVVSESVSTLKRLSLVRPSWDDADALHPVSPEVGLSALVANQEVELVERRREIDLTKAAVHGLVSEFDRWRAKERRGEMEFIVGVDAIRARIEELAAATTTEMVAFSMGMQGPDAMQAGQAVDRAAVDRRVALRSIYLDSIKNHRPTRAHARWLVDLGAQVRTTPVLPCRMVVFDREVALLPIDHESPRDGAVLLRGRGVLASLVHLFEKVWADATPLEDGTSAPVGPVESDELSDSDRAVLGLLARGLTDEAVARKLGVSLRTVRRTMARLMRQLGTMSRFETGVRVAELGLVSSSETPA